MRVKSPEQNYHLTDHIAYPNHPVAPRMVLLTPASPTLATGFETLRRVLHQDRQYQASPVYAYTSVIWNVASASTDNGVPPNCRRKFSSKHLITDKFRIITPTKISNIGFTHLHNSDCYFVWKYRLDKDVQAVQGDYLGAWLRSEFTWLVSRHGLWYGIQIDMSEMKNVFILPKIPSQRYDIVGFVCV